MMMSMTDGQNFETSQNDAFQSAKMTSWGKHGYIFGKELGPRDDDVKKGCS